MIRYSKVLRFLEKKATFVSIRSKTCSARRSNLLTSLNLNKQQLPKQPVPDLRSTADRYLRSVRPLLNQDEYRNTERTVAKFISDVGPKLQDRLVKRYENTDSWMNDWFLNAAYLEYRAPLIVASSPGTVGPEQKFTSLDEFFTFGARLIEALWDYNTTVKSFSTGWSGKKMYNAFKRGSETKLPVATDSLKIIVLSRVSGKMKQETVRGDPLDMQPYAMILGTHRRPGRHSDELVHTDHSKHVIILSNNNFFKLRIVDNNDDPLSETEIKAAIGDAFVRSREPGKSVGILTANCRDQWAEDHRRLKEIGNNAEILNDLEGALFILCLDKELPRLDEIKNIASIRAVQSMTGFDSSTNSGNRWHDKTVQYIVSPDGFVGMEYEHSPCEGVPVAVLHDRVLTNIANKSTNNIYDSIDFPKAEHLKFELDEVLEKSMERAANSVDKTSMDLDMDCFTFEAFGASAIKRAKQSPDSFIQMAMQVAFYKVHGKPPAHYESAGLRRFRNTRTECIRSTSIESVNFAKTMARDDTSRDERKEAMQRAIDTHKRLASEASTGQGVDRHLFGLRMIAKSENIELPELYRDVGFTRSTHFTLSSSQVPYKTASFMCYGPVVPDGYGCCYNPRPDDILFACSSFKSSRETCTKKFADALQRALRDMREIAESQNPRGSI